MASRYQRISPVGEYAPLHISAFSQPVNTTSATTITSGSTVVTPAAMTNIVVGSQLTFSGGTGATETVVVTAATGSTFTATFSNGHSGAYTITTPTNLQYIPVGRCVLTTAPAITAGTGVVVTPASITGMYIGQRLNVAGGTGTAEDVTVTAVDPVNKTFTATFANNHSGLYTITSHNGTFLGRVVVNTAQSGAILTLYNGTSNLSPTPSVIGAIAVINTSEVTPFDYQCVCDYGLFYTLTGSGSAPDITLTHLDMLG